MTGTRQSIQASTIIDGSQPIMIPSKKVTGIRLLHRHNGAFHLIDLIEAVHEMEHSKHSNILRPYNCVGLLNCEHTQL